MTHEISTFRDADGVCRIVVSRAGRTVLEAGAAINPAMRLDGGTPGLIGWFSAASPPPPEAAAALFETAANELGTDSLIGPVNGSTWEDYRAPEPGGRTFLLDCRVPDWCGELFEANGFGVIARYVSYHIGLDGWTSDRCERAEAIFASRGVRVESYDPARGRELLSEVHMLSSESFRHNFLYTPLSEPAFVAKYLPLLSRVNPEYVLLARSASGRLLGFLLAFENTLSASPRELVLKTLAAAPDGEARGVGTFLVESIHRRAVAAGFGAVYHALMHTGNISSHIGGGPSAICRRYNLYGKKI